MLATTKPSCVLFLCSVQETWSGMDPFDQLLDLRQGSSSIEVYVTQFCEIADKAPFDNVFFLKTFFVSD